MKLPRLIKKAGDGFLNALYKKHITCVCCGAELVADTRYDLCSKCMSGLPFVGDSVCACCGTPIISESEYCVNCKNRDKFFEKNRSPLIYRGIASDMIKKLKFGNKKYIAEELAKLMSDEYIKSGYNSDVVCCVPMFETEFARRGFNQSELLAKNISARLNIPYFDVLEKECDTSEQKGLSGKERRENLKGVFTVVRPDKIKKKNVLLVDDVFTTGATVNECARVLKKAAARSVCSLTACVTKFKIEGEKNRDE